MKPLPVHGMCFVCGTENPNSIGIQWYSREDKSIYGEIILSAKQQGPPGHVHGGASAALLDEAMGAAVWQAGYMVLAVNLNVNYRRPLPLGVPAQITAAVERNEGRKVYTRGEIRLLDGQVVVEGTGIFVEAPHMFSQFAESYQAYRQNNDSSSKEENL
jgi:uncharacterized protein (TIGR00369 family)